MLTFIDLPFFQKISDLSDLDIIANPKLKFVGGFDSLKMVTNLLINNTDLSELKFLEGLTNSTDIQILNNDKLLCLPNLMSMTTCDLLTIKNNDMLSDLSGLENFLRLLFFP